MGDWPFFQATTATAATAATALRYAIIPMKLMIFMHPHGAELCTYYLSIIKSPSLSDSLKADAPSLISGIFYFQNMRALEDKITSPPSTSFRLIS
jgi:hypothetical protein